MGNVCHVAKYQNSQHPLNDLWPITQIEMKKLKKKCLRITMSMLTNLTCLSTPAKSTPSIEWELFQANELSFSQGLVPFIKVKSTNPKQEILIYIAKHIKVQLEMETFRIYLGSCISFAFQSVNLFQITLCWAVYVKWWQRNPTRQDKLDESALKKIAMINGPYIFRLCFLNMTLIWISRIQIGETWEIWLERSFNCCHFLATT